MARSVSLTVCLAALVVLAFRAAPFQESGVRAAGNDSVTPGELVIDPPTLINLGFEWLIEGDDNRNAVVEVSYRKAGESAWKRALPMLRLQGERIYNGAQLDVV